MTEPRTLFEAELGPYIITAETHEQFGYVACIAEFDKHERRVRLVEIPEDFLREFISLLTHAQTVLRMRRTNPFTESGYEDAPGWLAAIMGRLRSALGVQPGEKA